MRLVEGLAERFELEVLARRIAGGVEISQPPAVEVPTRVGPASRLAFAVAAARSLARSRPDAVLVQGYGAAALAANLAGRLAGVPVLMLVCSPVEAYYRCRRAHPEPGKPFRRRELWGLSALARANALAGRRYLVLSRHLAESVRRHGGRRPVDEVPVYGVDTGLFVPPSEPKAALRGRLGLPAGGSLLFFSSRVAPEKDAETLLAALARLLGAGRDLWVLHRSGGFAAFRTAAERAGVAARVIATDAVHPHHGLALDYQAADLCVQASREEGLGFSPLEALACGVPVVAAAVGGLVETIVPGETGWTYPPGDAAALAAAIEAALADPVEAARRAAAGRRMVEARFERRRVFDRLEAVVRAEAAEAARRREGR